jgi:hypothetical protein
LIARVDVGTFVAIHFHRNEQAVDEFSDFRILVALAIDDVAPVAPDGADIEENRLVFFARAGERRLAPLEPADGLMRRGAQIRAGGILQAILDGVCQEDSFRPRRMMKRDAKR